MQGARVTRREGKNMRDFAYAKKREEKKKKKKRGLPVVKLGKYYCPIWLLPVAPIVIPVVEVSYRVTNWRYERNVWSEKKAKKVLDYALPHLLEYAQDEDDYTYCLDWSYYGIIAHTPFWLRSFAKKHTYEIKQFLLNGYEKAGYEKRLDVDSPFEDDEWVIFKKKEG